MSKGLKGVIMTIDSPLTKAGVSVLHRQSHNLGAFVFERSNALIIDLVDAEA
jgi:hypothetical protein